MSTKLFHKWSVSLTVNIERSLTSYCTCMSCKDHAQKASSFVVSKCHISFYTQKKNEMGLSMATHRCSLRFFLSGRTVVVQASFLFVKSLNQSNTIIYMANTTLE